MNKSKYKANSDIISEKKTETILVKVTPAEHEQLKQISEKAGFSGKIVPYIRSQALRPDANLSSGKLRQEIASLLCRHAQLVEKMDDQLLRKHFIDWEATVWQSIRS